jgi:hypothetical protein
MHHRPIVISYLSSGWETGRQVQVHMSAVCISGRKRQLSSVAQAPPFLGVSLRRVLSRHGSHQIHKVRRGGPQAALKSAQVLVKEKRSATGSMIGGKLRLLSPREAAYLVPQFRVGKKGDPQLLPASPEHEVRIIGIYEKSFIHETNLGEDLPPDQYAARRGIIYRASPAELPNILRILSTMIIAKALHRLEPPSRSPDAGGRLMIIDHRDSHGGLLTFDSVHKPLEQIILENDVVIQ